MLEGAYQAPMPLDSSINSSTYEFNSYISPDEDLIIFSSYGRSDDRGGGDLYFSIKVGGKWSDAQNLIVINSTQLDYCPFIDFRDSIFYFTSERWLKNDHISSPSDLITFANQPGNGFGDIYRISLKSLNLKVQSSQR